MTTLRLQPPEPFNFRNPDEWYRWKRRFEQYRTASGLSDENQVRQVSTLLSTGILEEDRKKYDKVVEKLDAFFKVRKNVIYERARFNQRNQGEGESVECYITALYQLVEFCEFGPLKDDLLRDRIVVGIRDKAVSQRMQLDSSLTLEKAKRLATQSAAVKEQQGELQRMKGGEKGNPIDLVIDEIGKEKKRRKQPYKRGRDSGPHKGGA